jgi:hypothetical protein
LKEIAMTIRRRLRNAPPIFWQCFMAVGTFFIVFLWVMVLANARDLGQWGNQDDSRHSYDPMLRKE